jgi:hypothetical protein
VGTHIPLRTFISCFIDTSIHQTEDGEDAIFIMHLHSAAGFDILTAFGRARCNNNEYMTTMMMMVMMMAGSSQVILTLLLIRKVVGIKSMWMDTRVPACNMWQ